MPLNKLLRQLKSAVNRLIMYFCMALPGLGKTTMASVIAHEMGANIRITSGPAIERAGDLASLLTNLQDGDILFIDEIHRLHRSGRRSFI